MKEHRKKYRIKDIAELAGVSVGTVDRVLHNRGEVSEENKKKIKEILTQINYHPNVFASALASKKTYTFVCILPQYSEGEYFEAVEEGISKAAEEFSDWNILIKMSYFDQFDESSCRNVFEEISETDPDAVLIVPTYKDATIDFINELNKKSIPFVFLDSWVDNSNPLAYFGQDSYASGYLAAKLLTEHASDKKDIVLFRMMRHSQNRSNQTIIRENGFSAYIKKYNPDLTIHSVDLHASDEELSYSILDDFFKKQPNVTSAIIFNSRAYIIGEYLQSRNLQHVSLVGYDLLTRNVACLKNSSIKYLIGQRPEKQGYNVIKSLARHFVLKQDVHVKNFMPIDILTMENIDYFINFELD